MINVLNPGKQGEIFIIPLPTALDSTNPGIAEVRDHFFKEGRFRSEVGIKYGDEITPGSFHSICKGPCLETPAVITADMMNSKSPALQFSCFLPDDPGCLIVGIIQNLDLQPG